MQTILPSCKSKPNFHIMAQSRGHDIDNPSFQTVDYTSIDPTLQTINVMSHSKDMHKTYMALSLAESYADAGFKTLFLEINYRHPVFHTYFNLETHHGLSDWMVDDTLPVVSHKKNLDILTSGSPVKGVARFLLSKNFKKRIYALQAVYDKIIIDTPALSHHLDALIISDYANGNLVLDSYECMN